MGFSVKTDRGVNFGAQHVADTDGSRIRSRGPGDLVVVADLEDLAGDAEHEESADLLTLFGDRRRRRRGRESRGLGEAMICVAPFPQCQHCRLVERVKARIEDERKHHRKTWQSRSPIWGGRDPYSVWSNDSFVYAVLMSGLRADRVARQTVRGTFEELGRGQRTLSRANSLATEKATIGGIKMRQPTPNESGREGGSKKQDLRPSDFCQVCQLTFGSYERRVFLGNKTVHPHCALAAERSRSMRVSV